MASESTSDNHATHDAARPRPSRENTVPSTLLKRDRSVSATSQIERTISITDSFVLEHLKHAVPHSPPSELDDSHPGTPRRKDEAFTPISNWAHLSYLKNQRNQLRTELKVHQVAGAEAKQSISSLRRLAFRMAVNISVKEKQIVNTARSLASSRKRNYLSTRDAEKRIEQLTKSLSEEEYRNKDILECLEKASMLTLQYSDPNPKVSNHMQPGLASPPSTPPTRTTPEHRNIGTPNTPIRPSSSLWDNNGWDFTPESSTADIRTSDSRLIQAKRESDRALAVCRNRIAELRAECAKSKDAASLLTETQAELEAEIEKYQMRIVDLEESKAAVEEILHRTKSQLNESTKAQGELQADLQAKSEEIENLEIIAKDRQETIDSLRKEKILLDEKVQDCNGRIQKLETYTTGLEDELRSLKEKLDNSSRREAELQDRLTENETASETMSTELKEGRENMGALEKSINFFKTQITDHSKKIKVSGGVISSLRNDLKESENLKKHAEAALAIAQGSLVELEIELRSAQEANQTLRAELDNTISIQQELKEELQSKKEQLVSVADQQDKFQFELRTLCESRDALERDLDVAQSKIRTLEEADAAAQSELRSLRDSKAAVVLDLEAAKAHSERLQKELSNSNDKLVSLQAHVVDTETKLQEAGQTREALTSQLRDSEQTRNGLKAQLEESDRLRSKTEERLNSLMIAKAEVEQQLDDNQARMAHAESQATSLQSQLRQIRDVLQQSEQSKIQLQASLTSAQSQIQCLNTEKSNLQEQISANMKSNSEAQEHLGLLQSEAAILNGRISELQTRAEHGDVSRAEVDQNLQEAMHNLDSLKNELLHSQELLATVDGEGETLRSKLASLEAEHSLVRASKEDVEHQLGDAEESQSKRESEIKSLTIQLNTMTSERDELRSTLSAYKKDLKSLRETRADLEERLADETKSNSNLDQELMSTRSKLGMFETENAALQARITDSSNELKSLQLAKADVDARLNSVSTTQASLEKELNSTRTLHRESEINATTLNELVASVMREADGLRAAKVEVEKRLEEMIRSNTDTEEELRTAHSQLLVFKGDAFTLQSQISAAYHELGRLGEAKADVEERFNVVTNTNTQVSQELQAVRSQLQGKESEGVALLSRVSEADNELKSLKQTNEKLDASEKDLLRRLEAAEEELRSVKDANAKLEAFVDQVEQDMLKAEEAVADSEQRIEQFVEESEAKISAAATAKLKYKRRLTARNKELEILMDENSELHHHVSDQWREIESLTKGKQKLLTEVQSKEKTIQELEWTHEQRLREEKKSKDDELEELRRIQVRSEIDYEAQLQKRDSAILNLKQTRQSTLQSELQAKDSRIDELQRDKDEFAASLAAVESELLDLRKSKEEYKDLVVTLNEKVRQLEASEETNRPVQSVEVDSAAFSDAKSHQEAEAGSSTPAPRERATSSVARSEHSRSSVHPDRPLTSIEPVDRDTWSTEFNRIRLLRNETANQLKGMKKVKHDLKKSLKDSDAQLHDLERSGKTKRQPNVLHKRNPSTLSPSPSRPATATLLSNRHSSYQHNSLFPDSSQTPDPVRPVTASSSFSPRRWTSLPRPGSSYRPATSKSFWKGGEGLGDVDERGVSQTGARPVTSAGVGGAVGREKERERERRRWSGGLRRLFHRDA